MAEGPELGGEALAAKLRERFPSVEASVSASGEVTAAVPAPSWAEVAAFLKDAGYSYLSSLHGVDYRDRLQVVANAFALGTDGRTRGKAVLKVDLPRESPSVASVTGVWPTADWHEREAFDLFGIRFEGHPDLRRILLSDDFEGHPLLKDFVDRRPPRERVTREG